MILANHFINNSQLNAQKMNANYGNSHVLLLLVLLSLSLLLLTLYLKLKKIYIALQKNYSLIYTHLKK